MRPRLSRLLAALGLRKPLRIHAAQYDCTDQFEPRIPNTTIEVVEESWDDGVWHRTYKVHRAVRIGTRTIGAFVQFGQDSNDPHRLIPHPDLISQTLDEQIQKQVERGIR